MFDKVLRLLKMPPQWRHFCFTNSNYLFVFSHCWLATPQLVLQADWQDVWHSPQPPFLALSQRFFVSRVLIFISLSSEFLIFYYYITQYSISQSFNEGFTRHLCGLFNAHDIKHCGCDVAKLAALFKLTVMADNNKRNRVCCMSGEG